ncbi:hypothetical protein ACQKM9_13015 [Viridibacillus sp. NPDC093762]
MVLHMKEVSLKREGQWILENINWQVEKGEHWEVQHFLHFSIFQ